MKQFFKFMFASMAGFLVSGVLLVIIFFMVLFGMVSGFSESFSKEKSVDIEENSVLHLTLKQPIVDRAGKNPFEDFNFGNFSSNKKVGLGDFIESIEKAKDDDNIKGIYMDLSGIPAGLATLEEMRNTLVDFKDSEKFIITYGENLSHGAYYLASVSDKIFLYPEGGLDHTGLSSEVMFLKGAMDKLNIDAQIIRGKGNRYKSAVEPFMYDKMSEESREQTSRFMGTIWNNMLAGVEDQRGISVDKLNMMADSIWITNSRSAMEYGLVDGVHYEDEVHDTLRGRLGLEADDEIELVSLNDYIKAPKSKEDEDEGDDDDPKPWEIKEKVAIVYAAGEIRSGKGNNQMIGSETVAGAIREARKDTNVKAIVLRVNSPGGSALASDVIWREVTLAKAAKPFVVSMGNLAASGGYYIACAADKIYASPHTITGSIGVFGMLPNLQGFWNEKLGVTFDRVQTNTYSGLGSPNRGLADRELEVIQASVDDIYDTFLQRVAEGRGLTVEQVDEVAKGRVWSGIDAIEKGLVDEFGNLDDAVAYAAEAAGLEEDSYKVKGYPEEEDPFQEFMEELSGEAKASVLEDALGTDFQLYQYLNTIRNLEGIQAIMPFYMTIE
ncbi:MAG: signal peptide peptidase SppA [Salibacteraceae bacterium]